MSLELWLAFVAASGAVLLIPGPTVLVVLSYALSQGRRVALATAAGVALGDLLAMSASLIGLGALVLTSATLFALLKWVGAGYLIWLGWRLWRSGVPGGPVPQVGTATGPIGPGAVFRHAALVTALNPKSIAFFIAFVPQFVSPAAPLVPQLALLIATFVSLAAANVLAYALLADRMRAHVLRAGLVRLMNRLGGATLIAMGLLTATLRRAS
jgi:threonine/homoserine/homoserine lactone efflux protein